MRELGCNGYAKDMDRTETMAEGKRNITERLCMEMSTGWEKE